MIHVKGIDWQPIAAMPEDRKDGRQILLWSPARAAVGSWFSHGNGTGEWWVSDWEPSAELPSDVRFWADVSPPE